MKQKGRIDDNVSIDKANEWILDVLNKAKKDALNISDEELDLCTRLLKRYIKSAKSFEVIRGDLSTKQMNKVWEGL